MSGENGKSVLSRLLSGGSLNTVIVFLIGQALFSIVYQVTNNEQQSAAIASNRAAIATFREDVFNLRTPLSGTVLKLEARLSALDTELRRIESQMISADATTLTRLDVIDTRGTRGLEIVSNTLQRVTAAQERAVSRLDTFDKRISDVENRAVLQLQGQVETIRDSIKRVDDQLIRTIQALDALYNSMQDHLRQHAPQQQPGPRKGGKIEKSFSTDVFNGSVLER